MTTRTNSDDNVPRASGGTGIIDRLRALSRSRSRGVDSEETAVGRQGSRSRSRGRGDAIVSTGRGGAGNFVPKDDVLDETADEPRGRELGPKTHFAPATHTARGGAGNVTSPSTDPAVQKAAEEDALRDQQVMREHEQKEGTQIHSTGRGGFGNLTRSRSPPAAPRPNAFPYHSMVEDDVEIDAASARGRPAAAAPVVSSQVTRSRSPPAAPLSNVFSYQTMVEDDVEKDAGSRPVRRGLLSTMGDASQDEERGRRGPVGSLLDKVHAPSKSRERARLERASRERESVSRERANREKA